MRSLPLIVEIVPLPTQEPANAPKPPSPRCARTGDDTAIAAIKAAPAKMTRPANTLGLLLEWFDPTISSDHAVVRPLHCERFPHLGGRTQKQRLASGAIASFASAACAESHVGIAPAPGSAYSAAIPTALASAGPMLMLISPSLSIPPVIRSPGTT